MRARPETEEGEESVSISFVLSYFLTFEEEDIQEVFFYAWLKSKALKRPYYEVLLEMLEN